MQHRPPKPVTPILGKPIVVFGLLILTVIAVISVIGMYQKYQYARAARDVYVQEKMELEEKRLGLSESAAKLETERGREEEIRSRYRAVKLGEELIVVVSAEAETTTPNNTIQAESRGFWKRITCWFRREC